MIRNKLYRILARSESAGNFCLKFLTAPLRCTPTALIVGAQKAGTSSLFSYLTQHPEIFGSFKKEVHYFDGGLVPRIDNFSKGIGWYKAHFPFQFRVPKHSVIIEASPSYLFLNEAARRIKNMNPEIRIIIMLRNPVERAISHYYHEVRAGREVRELEEALCVSETAEKFNFSLRDPDILNTIQKAYKARGIYYPQVKRFFELFGASHVYVVGSEQLFAAPGRHLADTFRFLGVTDHIRIKNLRPRNTNENRKKAPESIHRDLEAYFSYHNEKLFRFLGRRLW